jgi:hypothetical protein
MGIAVGLILAAIGLILALAIHPSNPGSVNVNTVGWILFIVGVVGIILDLLLWNDWGPGYMRRRRTYVAGDPGYGGYPARRWAPRRRIVQEEEIDGPPGPPPGY